MTTTDELRAAAERLRDLAGTTVDTWNAPGQAVADMWLLAEAYLSEHRADDHLPVDEAWLRSVGCEDDAMEQYVRNRAKALGITLKE